MPFRDFCLARRVRSRKPGGSFSRLTERARLMSGSTCKRLSRLRSQEVRLPNIKLARRDCFGERLLPGLLYEFNPTERTRAAIPLSPEGDSLLAA
jgi:hypothetical protein